MSTAWVNIDLFESDEIGITYSYREEDGRSEYSIWFGDDMIDRNLIVWKDVLNEFDRLRKITILPLDLEMWLRVNKEIPKELNKLAEEI